MLLWFFRNNTSKSKEGRNSCALDLGAVWGAINEKYQTRKPSRIRGFLKGIRHGHSGPNRMQYDSASMSYSGDTG